MGNEDKGEFMSGLLKSRKFWLAVFGVFQAVVLYFLDIPESVWQSISVLVAVLIAAIALEDAGEKIGNGKE